ncbi:hypothetical protein H4R19_007362, partial [Coemansia spiralis]
NSSKAGVTKSVHWFDSPVDMPREGAPTAMPVPLAPTPSDEPVAPVDDIPLPSATSSLESTMSIVLRSPSTKRPPARSPMVSLRVAVASVPPVHSRFPALPIASPTSSARLLLSHKASVSAVGGRQLRGNAERPRPSLDECALAHATSTTTVTRAPPPANSSGIVTIRARRSRSFAVNRKLERATVGRKRSNTIGTGRQAEAPSELRPAKSDDSNDIPRTNKNSRRVQSLILPAQYSADPHVARGRCATVIPLHTELQQVLEHRIAAAVERRGSTRRLRSPRMSDLAPMTAANKQQ